MCKIIAFEHAESIKVALTLIIHDK